MYRTLNEAVVPSTLARGQLQPIAGIFSTFAASPHVSLVGQGI